VFQLPFVEFGYESIVRLWMNPARFHSSKRPQKPTRKRACFTPLTISLTVSKS